MVRTAFDRDRSAVLGDDPLRNGETKSGAALGAASRLVDAVEAFENLALLFFGDSHS